MTTTQQKALLNKQSLFVSAFCLIKRHTVNNMDIQRSKDELTTYYCNQLKRGFPIGSLKLFHEMLAELLVATGEDRNTVLNDIRKAALHMLADTKRLKQLNQKNKIK